MIEQGAGQPGSTTSAGTQGSPADDWPGPGDLERFAPGSLFGLDGRVAIVTGAGGGLGRWISAGLAAAGASLVLTDLVEEPLRELALRLTDAGARAAVVVADLAEDDAPDAIVAGALQHFGRIDVLVNNAGVNRRLPIMDVEPDQLDWIWRINFRQPYLLARACARVMIEQGAGSVINIGSINALTGIEDLSLYAPTKAAMSQLTRVAAIEWARQGVRVNTIAPGFFDTPMNRPHWTHPTRAPWIMDHIPLCRPGSPSELVGLCLLLASDAGSYITGQTLVIDGGFTAGSSWNLPSGSGLTAFRETGGYGRRPSP